MAVVPTKNKFALVGYYVGIASLVPHVWFLGVVAVVLGFMGIGVSRRVRQGLGHAITAIVLGLAALVVWGGDRLELWTIPFLHEYVT